METKPKLHEAHLDVAGSSELLSSILLEVSL
jgi:hypothetical protein